VLDNICFGRPDATRAEVEAAANDGMDIAPNRPGD